MIKPIQSVKSDWARCRHFGPTAELLARLWGGRDGVQYTENFVPTPMLGRLPTAAALWLEDRPPQPGLTPIR